MFLIRRQLYLCNSLIWISHNSLRNLLFLPWFLMWQYICAIFRATPVSVGFVIDILLNCCVYISSELILLEKTCSVSFMCKFQLIGIWVVRYSMFLHVLCFSGWCLTSWWNFWNDLVTVFQNYWMSILATFYLNLTFFYAVVDTSAVLATLLCWI